MLNFSHALEHEKEFLINISSNTIQGTEAFTYLLLNEDFFEAFWCGRDENNNIKAVIFDNKDDYTLLLGEKLPQIFASRKRNIMIFDTNKTILPNKAKEINGKEILSAYMLLSQNQKLSFDDEKRYVYALRKINHSYSKFFAIKKHEAIISLASVSAVNNVYALIADVFTSENERNKGYAHCCINACISWCIKNNKIPFVLCTDNMCDFYRNSGFTYYGNM